MNGLYDLIRLHEHLKRCFLVPNMKLPQLTEVFSSKFFYVHQDSESSEEEEGISEEEFKKTEGYKLFKEALDSDAKRKNSTKK